MFGLFGNDSPDPSPEQLNEEALIKFVEDEFKRREEERRPFELQWKLNLAFLEGNQYVDVNTSSMTLEEIPKMYWYQEREVINHIQPNLEVRVAKLSRMRPLIKARPASGEQKDIRSAKVSTQLIQNTYNDERIQDKLNDAYWWLESCGSVFFKNVWDSSRGDVIAKIMPEQMAQTQGMAMDNMMGETKPMMAMDSMMGGANPMMAGNMMGETNPMMAMGNMMGEGKPMMSMGDMECQPQEIREGDLDVILIPAIEIYPDSPYHQDVDTCRSIIHAKVYHCDEIEEIWGIRVAPEEANAMKLQRASSGLGGLGYGNGGFRFNNAKLKSHAVVKEFWEIPTKKYPNGRLIIIAGNKLLHSGDLPYPVGEGGKPALPFVKCDCIKRVGCFWGRTIVERMIPVQRRYNALRNRKAEFLNTCAIGQWIVEDGSVDLDMMEQDAGAPSAIIPYQRGYSPPKKVDQPQLPVAFDVEENTLLNELTIISGVSEVARQSRAPNMKSGVAISLAMESDDTRLSSTAENIQQFLVACGKMWLRFYKHFVKGVRTLRIIGKNNVVELLDWTSSDLRSDDLVIESTSALAESPSQRKQMIFDLLNTPLFLDPNTGQMSKEMQSKLLDMLQLGHWETLDNDTELHIGKAERENQQMEKGMPIQPVDYDDHIIHISLHNKYRLSVDYEEIKTKNPQIDMIFEAHLQGHLMFIAPPPEPMEGPPIGEEMPPEDQHPPEEGGEV